MSPQPPSHTIPCPAVAWPTGLLALFAPGLALAQQEPAGASPDLGASLAQLGVGFALVVALLFGCLWLLKRITSPQGRSTGLMKVVSSLAIGPRERVVLMEVGDQWLLVGVGPGHISKLGEIPRQALPDSPANPAPEFSAWLKRAMEHRLGKAGDKGNAAS
ncbi:MAG: flagellar biosynthetic protein FliO [Rhodocyclaceae bacterium]|nr:MAG: flagellar biosynthetic protein FliO [Rhodocyclaceae bacterium]